MGNNPHSRTRLFGVAAVAIAAAALTPVLPWHFGYFGLLLGLVAALVAVGAIGAPTALRPGRTATRVDALRGLRGWHVVDAVELDGTIVDHVVVAPSAVLAIVAGTTGDRTAAEQAARLVGRLVEDAGTGSDAVSVVPMIWTSPADGAKSAHRVVGGVHVVDGSNPAGWLHLFREARFAPGPRLELCAALEARAVEHRPLAVGDRIGLVPPPEPAGA